MTRLTDVTSPQTAVTQGGLPAQDALRAEREAFRRT